MRIIKWLLILWMFLCGFYVCSMITFVTIGSARISVPLCFETRRKIQSVKYYNDYFTTFSRNELESENNLSRWTDIPEMTPVNNRIIATFSGDFRSNWPFEDQHFHYPHLLLGITFEDGTQCIRVIDILPMAGRHNERVVVLD